MDLEPFFLSILLTTEKINIHLMHGCSSSCVHQMSLCRQKCNSMLPPLSSSDPSAKLQPPIHSIHSSHPPPACTHQPLHPWWRIIPSPRWTLLREQNQTVKQEWNPSARHEKHPALSCFIFSSCTLKRSQARRGAASEMSHKPTALPPGRPSPDDLNQLSPPTRQCEWAPYWSLTLPLPSPAQKARRQKKTKTEKIKSGCSQTQPGLRIMNRRWTLLQTMEAPVAVAQLFRWLPASASLLGSPRLYTLDYRGQSCRPHGRPGPSNTNATQPIKEIWAGCSRRANTHVHAHNTSTLSMKNEDIRAHKTQLYLSPLPPAPSFHLLPFPLHTLFISPWQKRLKVIIHV